MGLFCLIRLNLAVAEGFLNGYTQGYNDHRHPIRVLVKSLGETKLKVDRASLKADVGLLASRDYTSVLCPSR